MIQLRNPQAFISKKVLTICFFYCLTLTLTRAGRIKLHQRVVSLSSRVLNVDETLMGSDLKVKTCIFAIVWRFKHTKNSFIGWQLNMTYGFYNHVVLATSMICLHKYLNSVTQYNPYLIIISCLLPPEKKNC